MIIRNVCVIIVGIAALVLIGALAYTILSIFITPEAEIEPDAPPDAPSNQYAQNRVHFLGKESKCSSNGSFYLFQWSCNTSPPHSNYYGGYYTLSECLGNDFNISNVSNKVKIGYRR